MKKFTAFMLAFICIFGLIACTNGEQNNAQPAYFVGKVTGAYETGCLVEIRDAGNYGALAVGTPVHVTTTNIENCPEYAVGDHIKVVFDGTVAESYPPQVMHVSVIEIID